MLIIKAKIKLQIYKKSVSEHTNRKKKLTNSKGLLTERDKLTNSVEIMFKERTKNNKNFVSAFRNLNNFFMSFCLYT